MRSLPAAFVAVLLLLLLAGPADAQPATSDPLDTLSIAQPLPVDPALRIGRLDNGFTYYIRANRRPEERAELRLVVNVGSVLEDEDQLGLAHLLEHMAFNGTERFTGKDLIDYLESIGMRFGPGVNASTGFDQTIYQLSIPLNVEGALESGFDILFDWGYAQMLDPAEVDKERGVVIEEWRGGRGAFARVRDREFPIVYRGSRYAERLPIGTRESLESFEHDALRRFYRDWYRPELMALVAVGDFDPDTIEGMVRAHFGGAPARAQGRERPIFPLPDHAETLVSIVTDEELPSTSVQVIYKLPLEEGATVGDFRKSLVERLYTSMFNSRLDELRQRPDAPFLAAGSGQGRLTRSKEGYFLFTGVKEDGILGGLEAILTEAERVDRHGFGESELERNKRSLLRGMERAYDERDNLESSRLLGDLIGHFLVEGPIPGIAAEYRLAQRFLPGITLEEVNALAREWIRDDSRVVLISAPEKEGLVLPSEQEVLALLGRVESADVDPWVDRVADAPLIAALPAPGRITQEGAIPELGVTRWTLSNGARVVIKPTDFKQDQVLFGAFSPGGHSLVPDEDYISAVFADNVASAGGLGELDQVELRKALAGKAASLGVSIAAEEESLSGQASPKDLETLLQLIHLRFTAPRRDSAAFVSLKTRMIEGLRNRAASPAATFSDTLNVVMTQGHPRVRPPSVERYQELDLDEAMAIYRDRFTGADDFTFFFVGNVQPDTLRPLVERYLASLPPLGRTESWRDTGIRPPTGVIEKVVRKGAEEQARTQIIFTGELPYDRRDSHALSAMADILEIRLRDMLREEMGGTYGVRVSGSIDQRPEERYTVSIGFAAAPDNLEEMAGEVFRQIDSLKVHGVTAEEVSKIQEQRRRGREESLQQNGFWMGQLILYERFGWDPREILTYEDEVIGWLNPQAVQDMARRTLDTSNYVRVSLYPEAWEGAAASVP